jgi:hypothetical protein
MDKQILRKELDFYIEKINSAQKDILRIEGIIIYLQNKIKEFENSNLTNT